MGPVLTELMLVSQLPTAVVPKTTYGALHLGSSRVLICLHNLGTHSTEILTKTVVGQVAPANQAHQWSSHQGVLRNPIVSPKRDGFWRP